MAGRLPPLRQLDIDPSALTLSLARGARLAAGLDPRPRSRRPAGSRARPAGPGPAAGPCAGPSPPLPRGQVETGGTRRGRAAAGGRPPAPRSPVLPQGRGASRC